MSNLMTKVTEQRAVRLMHRAATLLALYIVSFVQGERDEPVIVPVITSDRPCWPVARKSK
jgi:hypothetical protein